jgi:hypothetical protein
VRPLALALVTFALTAFASDHTPTLLLTPKLLRRLERDRTRQTVRWQNFENRVQNVPDSPERGFELALYYAVTHDSDRGRQAITWALAHKNEARQAALVLDWAADLITPEQAQQLKTAKPQNARDQLFLAIASDSFEPSQFANLNAQLIQNLKSPRAVDPATLYAGVEYLMAYRTAAHMDLREADSAYFSRVPKLFLLNLNPDQIEHPAWMAHIAALAMVTLDPNLESAQFLQGWAMEDRQMLREGPGVAYELLWADPYLPGIAYENMDPWVYDPSGLLFARTDWDPAACWIHITPTGFEQKNCDASKTTQPGQFGTLTLMRFAGKCTVLAPHKNRETIAFWKLPPRASLVYEMDGQKLSAETDAAGIWLVPNESSGRVCLVN